MLEVVNRLANNKNITIENLNSFIVEYSELAMKKTPTADEINQISQMLHGGFFNIRYALKEYCRLKNYQFIETIDLNKNLILKTEIYEL
jgi:hypothetical protein